MAEDAERQKVRCSFDVFAIDGFIDGYEVLNALRAIDLNPTIQMVMDNGGCDTKGQIRHTFDEFWQIYLLMKDCKLGGGFVDFIECLKIYDVGENGMMKLVDLTSMLLRLGERVTEEELDNVLADCQLEEEDDDGWFPYLPFLCRLCGEPIPKSWKPA